MEITNPHDKFFKESFTNKEIATDFIKGSFPKELVDNLDLSSLDLDNNSYIDEELKDYYSDLAYNCNYQKTKIKISILFEHKSFVPDYPFLQLLKYIIKIWDFNIKQKEKLIPVIPLIFYHGKDKWEYKKINRYFTGIDNILEKYIPDFDYLLMDLSKYDNEDIKEKIYKNEFLKISLLILKNIYDEEKLKKNLENFLILGKLYYEEEKGLKFLESVIRYLYINLENTKVEDIVHIIEKISEIGGKETMTIAMKLKEEGRIEAKVEDALNLIKEGVSIDIISRCTGLSKTEIERIMKKR